MIKRLLSMFPSTTINVDGKPYLTRYYLFLKDRRWGNVYVHHFHSSDQGDELHNHPWIWAISFVVRHGYWEEYRTKNDEVKQRLVKAPTIKLIVNTDFHRVDLINESKGSWSIFFAGPRTGDWGFWNRHTNEFKDWRLNPEAIP